MQVEFSDQAKLNAALINNIGIAVAREGGDAFDTGITMLRRAIALNPLDIGHRINLATFLLEQGGDEEAEELVAFVLKHDQRAGTAWQIMGVINTNRGRLADAIACFKRAYEIDPHGQRKFDLAAAYMRSGDFANGLPLYEHRHEILPRTGSPPEAPTWKGEKTGHIAVWPDQGHGDLIMFARFLPWAKERADKITFLVNPQVLALFQGYAKIVDVAAAYAVDTKFDHQICIASLPLVYGLTVDNIPPDPGLLSAADSVGQLPGGLKIGIAWQGNPQFPGDRMRSIPFREYLPLAADPRNTVYSLQVGPASADIAKARAQRIVRDMASEIEGEWSHTAALIKNLDLVVTSCTAIAHLAGALGVPTFVMLPLFADWRWFQGRDETPWYPRTRLFRQTRVGDWKSVVARVVKAVEDIHRQRYLFGVLNGPVKSETVSHLPATGYEPDVTAVIRKVLRPGDTFIDVGANAGIHTVEAAKIVGVNGRVIAFEPGLNVLPELRAATADMRATVRIVDKPAWNVPGKVTFFLNADNSGGNALWDPAEWPGPHNPKSKEHPQPVAMQATTLDAEVGAEAVRLIKIDTEGAEQRVLEGAERFLSGPNRTPFVIAELHEFGLDRLGCSQASLRKFMEDRGYATFTLDAHGFLPEMIPPGTMIRTGLIINLLFTTPEAVAECWPEHVVQFENLRSMCAYGLPPEDEKLSAA